MEIEIKGIQFSLNNFMVLEIFFFVFKLSFGGSYQNSGNILFYFLREYTFIGP